MNERHDDLQEIIDAALREMAAEEGDGFDPQACNLAEFCRRTGLTRSRARTVRAHGFRALPHGNSGRRAAPGVLAGHTGLVDDLLRKGVTNSQVIFERLLGQGYAGGLTTVKTYIAAHRDLVPAKRRQAAPQGCRGQRFRTAPGEAYQMDWGFVAVERPGGERARIACFAMVCHHCGGAHVEFFPNARQENLLIGMLHAFSALGVPATVLTVKTELEESNRQLKLGEEPKQLPDIGFRVFELDESGIEKPEPGQLLFDVVKPDRSDMDIVFEMMLKWGLELTLPVEKSEAAGYPIWSVACDELVCCMSRGLTIEALEAIADMEPRRVLILDSVLDDTLKLNAVQIFKHAGERMGCEIELRTV